MTPANTYYDGYFTQGNVSFHKLKEWWQSSSCIKRISFLFQIKSSPVCSPTQFRIAAWHTDSINPNFEFFQIIIVSMPRTTVMVLKAIVRYLKCVHNKVTIECITSKKRRRYVKRYVLYLHSFIKSARTRHFIE